jgi:hypothetical protein
MSFDAANIFACLRNALFGFSLNLPIRKNLKKRSVKLTPAKGDLRKKIGKLGTFPDIITY